MLRNQLSEHDSKYANLPVYKHCALPSNACFCILELLPNSHDTAIAYHLHLVDWTAPPPYETLSYAWGNNIKLPTICDGCILQVPPNLRNTLLRMRNAKGSKFLWADTICIDQINEVEIRVLQTSGL